MQLFRFVWANFCGFCLFMANHGDVILWMWTFSVSVRELFQNLTTNIIHLQLQILNFVTSMKNCLTAVFKDTVSLVCVFCGTHSSYLLHTL